MTSEQKALELDLIARVIGAYHTTRLAGTNANDHIWNKPHVREAFDSLIASVAEADKARHAAELREQAERFSERDERLGEALYGLSARLLLDGWFEEKANHDAYEKVVAAFGKPFILAPVDPLVEAIREMALTDATADDADNLRAALDARGLAIVKKETTNEG